MSNHPYPDIRQEYKCRRCGAVIQTETRESWVEGLTQRDIANSLVRYRSTNEELIIIHTCEDGGAGIADLIGVVNLYTMEGGNKDARSRKRKASVRKA